MSYAPVQPVNGLGYSFTIKIPEPIGNKTVSIPLETMANDVANIAVQAVFPILIDQLKNQLPNLMQMTYDAAKPFLEQEKEKIVVQAKQLMTSAETKVESQVSKTTNIIGMLIGVSMLGAASIVLFSKLKKKKALSLSLPSSEVTV
jgi:uncharacterized protein YaaW (UPF0174 family)